jgi:hypothetical protein
MNAQRSNLRRVGALSASSALFTAIGFTAAFVQKPVWWVNIFCVCIFVAVILFIASVLFGVRGVGE